MIRRPQRSTQGVSSAASDVYKRQHHHSDHIGGTKSLIERWPNVKVIASCKEKKRIPFQNVSVEDGETLNILGEEVKIIEVLGHTSSHIAFFLNGENPVLFIGDTLFSGGCGRIFEGTYQPVSYTHLTLPTILLV